MSFTKSSSSITHTSRFARPEPNDSEGPGRGYKKGSANKPFPESEVNKSSLSQARTVVRVFGADHRFVSEVKHGV